MNEHEQRATRESIDYQRGRHDGYNEGFAAGVEALHNYLEKRTDISFSYWLGLNREGAKPLVSETS